MTSAFTIIIQIAAVTALVAGYHWLGYSLDIPTYVLAVAACRAVDAVRDASR